ncbi:MAG: CRISPR-associated RAMP protein Csx7 [Oscillospiraceae bacterium]|nr:CRISPR-associated RAMP protein Csx7 [Oscillospiraceae bacterium]
MFAKLTNEAILTFNLKNEGPLLINSGAAAKIHPRPDMSFVRTVHNGEETVYLPGSSIKGVFRSRYEQVMKALGKKACNPLDPKEKDSCNSREERTANKSRDGEQRYIKSCEACKLFGSLSLGGRLSFGDAYPVGEWKMGMRHGVGIDRITGASFPGALFDIETLENGTFAVTCKITNFKLYQLRAVLWVLEDIHEGLVTFGMGGSRGNGQMRIANDADVELVYRKYTDEAPSLEGEKKDALFGSQVNISGLKSILEALNINNKKALLDAIESEVKS